MVSIIDHGGTMVEIGARFIIDRHNKAVANWFLHGGPWGPLWLSRNGITKWLFRNGVSRVEEALGPFGDIQHC